MLRIIVLLQIACIYGCAQTPNARGVWSGYVVEIPTFKRDGTKLNLMALKVDSGPDIPLACSENQHGWLPSPVLSDSSQHGFEVDPLLIGHHVRVFGTASQFWPLTDIDDYSLSRRLPQPTFRAHGGVMTVRLLYDEIGHRFWLKSLVN